VKTLTLLACAMADRGWRVRLVVPDYTTAPPFGMTPDIDVVRVSTGSGPRGLRMARFYLRLPRAVADGTAVCIANFYLTAHAAFLARVMHRSLRVVYFLQGDEAESHGRLADA